MTLVLILCVGATLVNFNMAQADGKTQISISRMDNLPSVATDYDYKDWKQTTKDYVDYVLSESSVYDGPDPWGNSLAENPSKVVSYEDASNIDAFFEETGNKYWSIRTYLGLTGGSVEAINSIAAVLSGAQIGLDMTNYSVNGQTPRNYVRDMVAFYQAESGFNVVLNNATGSGGSFWYALLPGCLFINLYQYYPQEAYLKEIIVEMSKVWLQCVENMGGANCDFSNCQGYDIGTSKPTYSTWKEPDAAAGLAYILYGGYSVAKDDPAYASLASGFLTGSIWCMDFMEGLDYSPFYEVLTFLAPSVASKLNALHGKNYDLTKYINWSLDGSSRVFDSITLGQVSAQNPFIVHLGGFIGRAEGYNVSVERCISASSVQTTVVAETKCVGGFVGKTVGGTYAYLYKDCFFDSEVNAIQAVGNPDSGRSDGITGVTTRQLETPSTFSTFDSSVWNIADGEIPMPNRNRQ